jgi:hypothetical protein
MPATEARRAAGASNAIDSADAPNAAEIANSGRAAPPKRPAVFGFEVMLCAEGRTVSTFDAVAALGTGYLTAGATGGISFERVAGWFSAMVSALWSRCGSVLMDP